MGKDRGGLASFKRCTSFSAAQLSYLFTIQTLLLLACSSCPPVALSSKLSNRCFSQHPYDGRLPRALQTPHPLLMRPPLSVASVYIQYCVYLPLSLILRWDRALGVPLPPKGTTFAL